MVNHVILIVLDGVGCGDAPDARSFGDEGSNTLSNTARAVNGLNLPNLYQLGLGNLTEIEGVPPTQKTLGSYGRLTEVSAGKDTTTGHWELAGLIQEKPFPVYPQGFPPDVIQEFESQIGRETLGNIPASGTEIIKDLGEEHLLTGKPIIYTSADSVFQIAAHEQIVPIEELYWMCQAAREILAGEHAVGRVIARPFLGQPGDFKRTERRKDFSLEPPSDTILDSLKSSGFAVMAVGKIEDIFAHKGLTMSNHTTNNMAGVDALLDFLDVDQPGLIFANLVDFDSLFGHRNDPHGFAKALKEFDRRIPEITQKMNRDDILIITADHGNDPTTPSTDHSRERVPVLIYGDAIKRENNMGTRNSFADLAATIREFFGVKYETLGVSFRTSIQ